MTLFQNSKENLWVGANDEGIVCIKKDGSILSFDKDDGLPINSVRSITEDKNGKRLSIKFAGISFISSEQVQFKYKLTGFDADTLYLLHG